jgi:hypothetical protein
MLLVGAVCFWAWRAAPVVQPCTDVEVSSSTSPRALADVFERRCGDSVSTHVALRPLQAPRPARADVFVAAGSVRVRLSWSEAGDLVVESPARRVMVEETHWRSVGVRVRRVR